jgi:hypothetical protein
MTLEPIYLRVRGRSALRVSLPMGTIAAKITERRESAEPRKQGLLLPPRRLRAPGAVQEALPRYGLRTPAWARSSRTPCRRR